MSQSTTLEITASDTSLRLDLLILRALRDGAAPEMSRAELKRLFAEERVRFHEKPVVPSLILPPGRHLITLLDWQPSPLSLQKAAASEIRLPVLYEDEDLLILSKPSGMPSVPHSAAETNTAVNAALAHLPALAGIGPSPLECGLLHRLDTGTSGVLAFAKNNAEYDRFRNLWKTPSVRKIYRAQARTETPPPRTPLEITVPLGHDAKKAGKMLALSKESLLRGIRGKPLRAVTRITTIHPLDKGLYDCEVEIETGVMHQIRCHLASVGLPLEGDPKYGGVASSRLWLHAWRLSLPLRSGTNLTIEAPLPGNWPGQRPSKIAP